MAEDLFKKYGVKRKAVEPQPTVGANGDERSPQAVAPTVVAPAEDIFAKYGVKRSAPAAEPNQLTAEQAYVGPQLDPDRPLPKALPKNAAEWTDRILGLPGDAWDSLTSAPKNSSARATLDTMAAAAGLTRTALREVANQVKNLGSGPLSGPFGIPGYTPGGGPDWKHATHAPGWDTGSKVADFVADTVTDPMNSIFTGARVAKGFRGKFTPTSAVEVAGPAPAVNKWDALTMNMRQPVEPVLSAAGMISPIANLLREGGKRVFRMPFKKVDTRVSQQFRGAENKVGPHAWSDQLWNNAEPEFGGFGADGQKQKQQLKGLKQAEWESMKAQQGDVDPIDLAPVVTDAKTKFGEAAAAVGEDARKAQDEFILAQKDRISKALRGGPNERQDAIDEIKRIAPLVAGMIDENASKFKTGEGGAALQFLDQTLNDVLVGPRTADEFQGLVTNFGREAAGSEAMTTNAYKERSHISADSVNNMGMRKKLSELLEDHVEAEAAKKLGSLDAGSEARKKYKETKGRYSILARGEPEALKVIEQASNSPILSKFDVFNLLFGSKAGNAAALVGGIGAKGWQGLQRWPRMATGTGKLLNDAGRSNLWDSMLRRSLLDNATRREEQ